jgi:hypothetical protein
MTRKTAVMVIIGAVITALIVVWIGIRLVVAERNSAPSYILTAGTDTIRQEWGYSSRFDNETKNLTRKALVLNRLNVSLFSASRPLFSLENRISGTPVGKGNTDYARYMGRVQQVRSREWDYVISSHPDGRELYVVKKNAIIQKVD